MNCQLPTADPILHQKTTMSYLGWYSKKDVLKDLRKATGKFVHDLDEAAVLVGEQPPPQQYNIPDEDAELELTRRFGGGDRGVPERTGGPDLSGITQMVRMVNGATEKEPKEEPKSPDTLLRISKLNPNVKEFIPKSSTSIKCSTSNNKKTDDICDNFKSNVDKGNLSDPEMKSIMKERLRNEIEATSHTTCVVTKRDRNMAIQSLLKLHCVPQTEVTDDQKPKLIAPSYFEKSNLAENKTTAKLTNGHCVEDFAHKCPRAEPSTDNTATIAEIPPSYIAASVEKVQKWMHASENAVTEDPKITINKDDAHEKVANSQADTQKESTDNKPLFLGPVTFKRKAPSKPMSPTSTVSNECVKTPKTSEYKPTEYAAELVNTYKERNKLKEELDLWTKLEAQLKAKDEVIKKKQAEANAQAEGSME